jgi:hypothetical protein
MPVAVFDLDGVLIDSKRIVIDAYRDAGVEAPDNILACEGVEWGQVTHHQRTIKNIRYVTRIGTETITWLPPLQVAGILKELGNWMTIVMSGAPHGTLSVLRKRSVAWPFRYGYDGLKTPDKMRKIASYATVTLPGRSCADVRGVYVDDNDRFISLPGGWRFIHYTGQPAEELLKEIIT